MSPTKMVVEATTRRRKVHAVKVPERIDSSDEVVR